VTVLALYAVLRSPDNRGRVNGKALAVGGGIVFPVVVLTALLVYGTQVGAALRVASASPAMRIDVVGHQWWWEVRYPLAGGFVGVTNELHLPVGETVEITLRSADVIHSFWVPNLAGKVDLIPGRVNRLVLRADRPGRLRGQCAEFCGGDGHARMTFEVIVEPRAEFERWLAMQPVVAQPGVASTDVAQGRP
jgi:cytochrome c oxidase subunit 2